MQYLATLAPGWAAQPLVPPAEVGRYIPQQPPFALIDTLYHCHAEQAWAGLLVLADNLLVQAGYLSEAGIIESMAQAVALKSGYEARQLAGVAPRIGFIAALKEVRIHTLVPVGRTLLIQVQTLLQTANVLVVKTTSSYDTIPVGQCEMRLFLAPPAGLAAPAPLTTCLVPSFQPA